MPSWVPFLNASPHMLIFKLEGSKLLCYEDCLSKFSCETRTHMTDAPTTTVGSCRIVPTIMEVIVITRSVQKSCLTHVPIHNPSHYSNVAFSLACKDIPYTTLIKDILKYLNKWRFYYIFLLNVRYEMRHAISRSAA